MVYTPPLTDQVPDCEVGPPSVVTAVHVPLLWIVVVTAPGEGEVMTQVPTIGSVVVDC